MKIIFGILIFFIFS